MSLTLRSFIPASGAAKELAGASQDLKQTGQRHCKHCGTPFYSVALVRSGDATDSPDLPDSGAATIGQDPREDFCCSGCQFVYSLIHTQGLGKFYDLTQTAGASLPPVKSLVFQKRDYTWLRDLSSAVEAKSGGADAVLTLDLQGISCLGCLWLIERVFHRQPGALTIQLQATLGRLTLRWQPGAFDVVAFAQELQGFGYLLGPLSSENTPSNADVSTSLLVRKMGLCAAFAMNAMLFSVPVYFGMSAAAPAFSLFMQIAFGFATLSFLTGGVYFFRRAWQSLRQGMLHIDLPISLGLIAAYAGSIYAWSVGVTSFVYFDFVSTFTFLMLLGRWVQQAAVTKNRNRLLGSQTTAGEVFILESASPASGEIDARASTKQPATALQPGDVYEIAAGAVIPVRSKLVSHAATLGLEWINGESEAQSARQGQLLSSGAVNYTQSGIRLEAVEPWESSILASLLKLQPREYRQPGLERFLRIYLGVVLTVAAIGFAAWLLTTGDWLRSLQVLTSILVVSCPCAAGVAIPLADEVAASRLRKNGVFVREQSLWGRLPRVRKILFDKTGTLTLETMAIANEHAPDGLAALPPHYKEFLLALVLNNHHPVSCCLREALMASGVTPALTPAPPNEIVGFGLQLETPTGTFRLGRPGWHTAQQIPVKTPDSRHDCAFSLDGQVLARFCFTEQIRPDAAQEIAALQKHGLAITILSGDRAEKVATTAKLLGLEGNQWQAEMTPQEKADWIHANSNGADTLMIGDGANDSLAFNASACTGTPAVDRGLLENKADFYFLGRSLNGLRELIHTAGTRNRAARRVITFAIGYNLIAVTLCLLGVMNPLLAAILMPTSSLVSIAIVLVTNR